ncbi:hypothetical protein [Acetobacter ascendens]|uniref:hypothetical protein n=1 Tax=Acetobacter ascendens TaxID=481146 RepID=UPI0012FFCCC0|nr:hypothetical protein [Acetobacter ascendens]
MEQKRIGKMCCPGRGNGLTHISCSTVGVAMQEFLHQSAHLILLTGNRSPYEKIIKPPTRSEQHGKQQIEALKDEWESAHQAVGKSPDCLNS